MASSKTLSSASTFCLGSGLVLVAVGIGPAGIEIGHELEEKALDAGHALPVQVVHQPAQDALIEHRVGFPEEVDDDLPFGLGLGPRLGRTRSGGRDGRVSHSSISRPRRLPISSMSFFSSRRNGPSRRSEAFSK